jgi:DNA-binding transcriptional MerR regulator
MAERYVNREEAARLAGVHWNTIRLWERTGRLTPKREMQGDKARVMIPLSQLQVIIEERGAGRAASGLTQDQMTDLRSTIARLEAELESSRERLAELRNERDRLLSHVLDTEGGQ